MRIMRISWFAYGRCELPRDARVAQAKPSRDLLMTRVPTPKHKMRRPLQVLPVGGYGQIGDSLYIPPPQGTGFANQFSQQGGSGFANMEAPEVPPVGGSHILAHGKMVLLTCRFHTMVPLENWLPPKQGNYCHDHHNLSRKRGRRDRKMEAQTWSLTGVGRRASFQQNPKMGSDEINIPG